MMAEYAKANPDVPMPPLPPFVPIPPRGAAGGPPPPPMDNRGKEGKVTADTTSDTAVKSPGRLTLLSCCYCGGVGLRVFVSLVTYWYGCRIW